MKTEAKERSFVSKVLRSLMLMGFLFCAVLQVRGATYYVATNGNDTLGNGSVGQPWATIGHADAAGLLVPGDTVIIEGGTYPQTNSSGVLLQVDAGTASQPITYVTNGPVIINQSGNPATSYGFQVYVSGIVLNGFEIKGATEGISLNGVSDCVVENCVIHDSTPTDSSGIELINQDSTITIHNNVIYNINASGNSPWSNVGVGIRDSDGDNINVWNNTIDNCYLGVFYYGASPGGGPYGHITTYNNIVVNSTGWAFVNPWQTDPSYFTNGYNLIYNDTTTYGNYPAGNNGPEPTDVTGNPQFVFPAEHDYYLLSNSPAIDAGTNVGLPYTGTAPNIGAFDGAYPPAQIGTISGTVTANVAGNPAVPGALVKTQDGSLSTTADVNGNYSLVVPAGNATLVASARNMTTESLSTSVSAGGVTTLNFSLSVTTTPQTYHVDNSTGNDSNPGTLAQPWKTIGNGDRLGVLNPGDTVIIDAGTYSQASSTGVSLTNNSGYSFAPITYTTNGGVLIDQSSYSNTSYGFNVAVSGIVLSGFEIKGAQHGIYLGPGSSYCTVNGCLIHDANAAGQDASGIFASGSPNDTLERNVIYNITATNDTPWSPVGSGIRDSDSDNLQVYNNTVDNCYLGVFYYGASLGAGPYGHITTYNNIVVNSAGWAFVNPWLTDPSYFTNGYNLIYNDTTTYGNYPAGNNGPEPTDVTGNPQFVNGATHNYQLQTNSPALNSGTYVGLPFIGPGPDIGAFESSYIPPVHTYFVDATNGNDSNPGTITQPWKTIGNGDAKGILNPGDTVVVDAGTYVPASSGGIQLTNSRGTAYAAIVYTTTNGTATINNTNLSGTSYGFYVGVAGITINGFEIKGAEHGVYLSPGSSYCTVNGCVIHDANAVGQDASGIWAQQSPNDTLTRNIIYNVNDVSDAPWTPVGCGIRDGDSPNLNVWNNTIDNCYLGLYYHGPVPGAGPYGHITTYNNIVVNCTGWGFVNPWDGSAGDFTSGYNLIYNDATTYGNYPAGNNGPLPTDVAQNPLFVNEAAHNYYLQSSSPAIEAGINVGLPYSGSAPSIGALQPLLIISQIQNYTTTVGDAITFTVNVLSPQPYGLQWLLNGIAIPGATGDSYTLNSPSLCDNGAVFSVIVTNSVESVTNIGTVLTVIPTSPSLQISVAGVPQNSNSAVNLTLTGLAGHSYFIDISTNLASWSTVGTFYNPNGVMTVSNVMSTNAP